MRVEVFPSPYGFSIPTRFDLNWGRLIKLKAFSIAFFLASQFTILAAWILPFCRSPILIVATLRAGASKIPLELLPTTASTNCNTDKYKCDPIEVKAIQF